MNKAIYIPTTVDQILVPHMCFRSAKLRIETHLLAAQNYLEPTCIAVVGESRTGKSRLLESITKENPRQRTTEGLEIPVLSIKTPAKPSVKGLVEILLREIDDPLWHKRGSENEKTEQLYKLLKETKTHTLIIDEFQHFYDKVSHKVQHYLSDWLKIFVDRSGLMLIVAGLPDCMAVINLCYSLGVYVYQTVQADLFKPTRYWIDNYQLPLLGINTDRAYDYAKAA